MVSNHESLIQLDTVRKVYSMGKREYVALREVNLRIFSGELVAIIGPSGSGKSTLLNMITGIDKPTSGLVKVDGQIINNMSENDLAKWRGKSVGIVFQFFQLLPTLTALENVTLPMEFRGTFKGKRRERALESLRLVGLENHATHLPSELSGGEQQRVAIARALANDPPLIVADEPTGNLDSTSGELIIEILTELNRRGKTIVFVTHDQRLAERSKRVVRVQDGLIHEVSSQ